MIPLAWVKHYQKLDFVVHPCCPHDHHCPSPGKIPFDPYNGQHMQGWQNHGQFPLEKWEEWLDLEPEINIGFLCGSPSRLLCVDIDNPAGEGLFNGRVDRNDRRTWRYETGKGSRYLYRSGTRAIRSSRISRGDRSFEVLGDGRQSVLPPSLHPSGRQYQWDRALSPRSCGILAAPRVLILGGDDISSEEVDWKAAVQAPTTEGARNETLTKLAGHLLAAAPIPPEEAFLWLKLYSEKNCKPPLADGEIKAIVQSINGRQQRSEAQVRAEIKAFMERHPGTSYAAAKVAVEERALEQSA